MTAVPFTPPSFNTSAFNCPFCHAFANQTWGAVQMNIVRVGGHEVQDFTIVRCARCGNYGIWYRDQQVFPGESAAPLPNPDLPADVLDDFNEAREILNKSPRGAAALLRLAVQKLCIALGKKGDNLNEDIAALVKDGLPVKVQQALDTVRVIGNNAVHPGQMDLKDDVPTATSLFHLVNITADTMITQPKDIDALFQTLPQKQREAVKKRDS